MDKPPINWLLDQDYYEGEQDALRAAIEAEGMDWQVLTRELYYREKFDRFPYGEQVFFFGTLQVAQTLKREGPSYLEVFLNPKAMECANYYSYFGGELLNSLYVMVPWGELKRLRYDLEDLLDIGFGVFARPNSGLKGFSGQILPSGSDVEAFEKWWGFTSQFMKAGDLVVASGAIPASAILAEYRFFVVDYKVVAWSQYKASGRSRLSRDVPEEAIVHAKEMVRRVAGIDLASIRDLDLIERDYENTDLLYRTGFVIDTCEVEHTDAEPSRHVVEINSLSCSGMYAADPRPIICAMRDLHYTMLAELELNGNDSNNVP